MYKIRMEKNVIGFVFVILILFAIIVKDVKFHIIPNYLVISLAIIGLLIRLFEGDTNLVLMILDSVSVSAVMAVISLVSKGAFGGGDIKLMIASGLLLGYRKNIEVFVIAMILTLFVGSVQILRKKKKIKDAVPLGPMISIGMIWGYINVYLIT